MFQHDPVSIVLPVGYDCVVFERQVGVSLGYRAQYSLVYFGQKRLGQRVSHV